MKTTLIDIYKNCSLLFELEPILKYKNKRVPDDTIITVEEILDVLNFDNFTYMVRTLETYKKELRLFAVWCGYRLIPYLEKFNFKDTRDVTRALVAAEYCAYEVVGEEQIKGQQRYMIKLAQRFIENRSYPEGKDAKITIEADIQYTILSTISDICSTYSKIIKPSDLLLENRNISSAFFAISIGIASSKSKIAKYNLWDFNKNPLFSWKEWNRIEVTAFKEEQKIQEAEIRRICNCINVTNENPYPNILKKEGEE